MRYIPTVGPRARLQKAGSNGLSPSIPNRSIKWHLLKSSYSFGLAQEALWQLDYETYMSAEN